MRGNNKKCVYSDFNGNCCADKYDYRRPNKQRSCPAFYSVKELNRNEKAGIREAQIRNSRADLKINPNLPF